MLFKIEIELTCLREGQIRGMGGEALHGLFFTLLKEAKSEMADLLHKAEQKPFSISVLRGDLSTGVERRIAWGGVARFSIRSYRKELSALLEDVNAGWQNKDVRLGTAWFNIKSVSVPRESKKRYTDIYMSTSNTEAVELRFLTPTSFRQVGTQVVLPLPELVFGSLLHKWNNNSEIPFPQEIYSDLNSIRITKHSIKTSLCHFDSYKIIGFTGEVAFVASAKNPLFSMFINALAQLAEYSGVGYKSTMGLGEVKINTKK